MSNPAEPDGQPAFPTRDDYIQGHTLTVEEMRALLVSAFDHESPNELAEILMPKRKSRG